MKPISLFKLALVACSSLVSADVSFAQMGMSGPPTGVGDAQLVNLFGKAAAFTARCNMRVVDTNAQEQMSMTMDFAMLEGKVRVEVDLGQTKSKDMPPEAAAQIAQLKQMGMDRIISINRPDKKMRHIVYPGLKASLNMALPQEEADALDKPPKIEKAELGKETIDGHPCVKNKVTVTEASGKKGEYTVWNAGDLKDFPVQLQHVDDGMTVIMLFKDIQLAKPAAAKFEVPADCKQYDSMQAMQAAIMARMMGGAGGQ